MRSVRVVPCLDVDAGRVVKGVNFVGLRDAGDPVELARRYDEEGADELVFFDITASSRRPGDDGRRGRADRGRGLHPAHRRRRRAQPRGRPARCCAPARTRSRSTPPRSRAPASSPSSPATFGAQCVVVAIDARRRSRRRLRGRTPTAAGGRPASTRSTWAVARRAARRRRAPRHLDGPRRDRGRLRPRAARARSADAVARPGRRLGRGRDPRPPRRRAHAPAPTRCSPRRSSTTAATRSPRRRRTSPRPGHRGAPDRAPEPVGAVVADDGRDALPSRGGTSTETNKRSAQLGVDDDKQPITMLNDRVLVHVPASRGRAAVAAGDPHPRDRRRSRSASPGPRSPRSARTSGSIKAGDKVLFNPEECFEVEVQGDELPDPSRAGPPRRRLRAPRQRHGPVPVSERRP